MFSQEKSASAQLPAARGVRHWLRRGFTALARAQARRTALRELYALDNRMLQDIGLSREQVEATVSAMFRRDPIAEATQKSREVTAGGAAQVPALDASNDGRYKSAA